MPVSRILLLSLCGFLLPHIIQSGVIGHLEKSNAENEIDTPQMAYLPDESDTLLMADEAFMMNHTHPSEDPNDNHTGHHTHSPEHTGHTMDHTGHPPHNTHPPGHTGHPTGHTGHPTGHTGHPTDHPPDHSGGHTMIMYFHASEKATILFANWTTDSWNSMLGSCFIIGLIAILYEGLKSGRERLLKAKLSRQEDYKIGSSQGVSCRRSMFSCGHLVQTLLHFVQLWLSYWLMLIFMTYNVYLCLAVSIGAMLGYFLFAWHRSSVADSSEHCV